MKKTLITVAALATLGIAGAVGTHKTFATGRTLWDLGASETAIQGKKEFVTIKAGTPTYTLQDVYRLYNKNTGEHFYTASAAERNSLQAAGWSNEGIGWIGATSGTPVYRVYNPNAKGGDHYYTMSKFEAQTLVNQGWKWDNGGKAAFYSAGDTNLNVAYNPNATSGAHNYTTNSFEQSTLLNAGWKFGAVAWKVEGLPTMKTTGVTINLKSSTMTVKAGSYTPELNYFNVKNIVVNGKVYSAQTVLNDNNKSQMLKINSANTFDGGISNIGGGSIGSDTVLGFVYYYNNVKNLSEPDYQAMYAAKAVQNHKMNLTYTDTSGNKGTASFNLNIVK